MTPGFTWGPKIHLHGEQIFTILLGNIKEDRNHAQHKCNTFTACGKAMRYYTEYESPLGTIIMLSEGAALTGLYMLEGNRYVDTILSGTEDKVNVFVKPDEQRVQACLNTLPWRENEGEANVFVKPNEQRVQACLNTMPWRENEGEANVFVKPNEQGVQDCLNTMPWRENEGEANDSLVVFSETRLWLDRYFSGDRPVKMPKIELKGSAFQKEVWGALLSVPYGSVTTYGQIAKVTAERMGRRSMSAQAIGNAVGRNPIMILVPCHRVIKADGSIGGFSAGVERKKWLLEHERQACLAMPSAADIQRKLIVTEEDKVN